MKIKDLPAVSPIQAKPTTKAGSTRVPPPEKSAEASNTELTVDAAKRVATQQRAARLEQLEAAIRSGHYVPNASQIANQILATAELDAKLRVMLTLP